MANKKSKGKDPAGSQSLPRQRKRKVSNKGVNTSPVMGGIADRSERKRIRASGHVIAESIHPSTGVRRLPPGTRSIINTPKRTLKGYGDRRTTGGYKVAPNNRTGGSPRNSGMSKKQVKNPKR